MINLFSLKFLKSYFFTNKISSYNSLLIIPRTIRYDPLEGTSRQFPNIRSMTGEQNSSRDRTNFEPSTSRNLSLKRLYESDISETDNK